MRSFTSFALAVVVGCSVKDRATSRENDAPYACSDNRDCSVGVCLKESGICARESGDISTVLFEVTPRASEPVYGGARYLRQMDLASANLDGNPERGIKEGWLELNVPPRVPVSGSIKVDAQALCVSRPVARSTLPATLVFTPRQRLLGLAAQSYEMSTEFDTDSEEFVFQGSLPPGRYDVYMRPKNEELRDCTAIPQLFRNQLIARCTEPEGCRQEPFVLQQQPPRSLRLTIPWRPEAEGWLVDIVHPVTGEVISNRVRLTAADASGSEIVANLIYSPRPPQPEADYALDQEEVVRLTPPDDTVAGTVLLQISGLVPTLGEARVGDVFTFGTPVDYQAWVWKEGESESPVPGVVHFSALDLDALEEGVFASFSASAEIDERGQVSAKLLPGSYRIRVTPPALDDPTLGLLAGLEWTGTVWPPTNEGPPSQAGHVIPVPAAVTLEGTVVAEHGDEPLRGVEVRASAPTVAGDACANAPADNPEPSEGVVKCLRPFLRDALARDPYVPRTRSGLTGGNGIFAIDGLDCGPCEPEAGAAFVLSVRPGLQTGLAWWLRTGVQLDRSLLMEPLEMPIPVAFPVQLTYSDPTVVEEPTGGAAPARARQLPGALVRVFAFIDNRGQVANDAAQLVPCVTIADPRGDRCIQSLLQIAELRSDSDGEFLLLLPPRIE